MNNIKPFVLRHTRNGRAFMKFFQQYEKQQSVVHLTAAARL